MFMSISFIIKVIKFVLNMVVFMTIPVDFTSILVRFVLMSFEIGLKLEGIGSS